MNVCVAYVSCLLIHYGCVWSVLKKKHQNYVVQAKITLKSHTRRRRRRHTETHIYKLYKNVQQSATAACVCVTCAAIHPRNAPSTYQIHCSFGFRICCSLDHRLHCEILDNRKCCRDGISYIRSPHSTVWAVCKCERANYQFNRLAVSID